MSLTYKFVIYLSNIFLLYTSIHEHAVEKNHPNRLINIKVTKIIIIIFIIFYNIVVTLKHLTISNFFYHINYL